MKILHVAPATPFGGAQKIAIDLAALQHASGLDSKLLFLDSGESSWSAAKGCNVELACDSGELRGRLSRWVVARRAMVDDWADIIHVHMPPPWLLPLIKRRGRSRAVMHLHTRPPLADHAPVAIRRLDHFTTGRFAASCDRLIAISQWVSDAYKSSYPNVATPYEVIPNGVPIPKLEELTKRHSVCIGVTSRLAPMKGLEEFLGFAEALVRRVPAAQFFIAGEGEDDYRQGLQTLANMLGIASRVTFVGFVSDVRKFWGGMDIAAFTAPFEPFGLRLIEPVSFGVPVVAYRTLTGSDEVISNCRGIAAVPYGMVEELALVASRIAESRSVRIRMAVEGREDLHRNYSSDLMAARVRACYLRTPIRTS